MPWIADDHYLIAPIHLSTGYALSLSTTQLVGILLIALLTWTNTRGLEYGRIIQNVFTTAKTGALLGADPASACCSAGTTTAVADNFGNLWTPRGAVDIVPGLTAVTAFGLFVAICVVADRLALLGRRLEQHHVHRRRGEGPAAQHPAVAGARHRSSSSALYLLANVAYLVTLPFDADSARAGRSRGDGDARTRSSRALGATIMAIGDHDLDLRLQQRPDPRRRARLLRDGARRPVLPARRAAERRARCRRGGWCCRASGRRSWCCRAPTIRRPRAYGNLYSNLLDYVISAALIFYILTIAGIFRLRQTRPDADRPYRAFGYPVVPALYIVGAATILLVLFVYRTATTWPGLVIVLLGVPVYFAWKPRSGRTRIASDCGAALRSQSLGRARSA